MPENDILSDPGLRKELLPGWWDSNGFKLPQTYIKTVPLEVEVSFHFLLLPVEKCLKANGEKNQIGKHKAYIIEILPTKCNVYTFLQF